VVGKYSTDPEQVLREVEIDFYRSSGPGGQHANKSDTAVRIKHLPSGITVTCEEHRSQHRNKESAFERLIKKLKEKNKPVKRRYKTRPTRASKERRLKSKKRKADIKGNRKRVNPDD